MTLVMAYVVLVTAGIGACAAAIETALRPRSVSLRWTWVVALAVAPLATAFAFFAPLPIVEVPVAGVLTNVAMDTSAPLMVSSATTVAASTDVFRVTDVALPLAWLVGSVALLIALAVGQWRFRAERRRARQARIADHDVLVTRELGPAVAGVWKPVVFVPEWVTALDEASVRLLLAHEHEHVKERDTSLLLFGAVSAAAMPWNPVVWWMVRRLRQAVEQDCDARVLAAHPGVRRYADLLLTAASRHGLGARLLAAHFGEEATDLLRRIEAMTSRNRMPWARITGTSIVAAALVAAACEAPRPDPVSPIAPKSNVVQEQEVRVVPERSAEFAKILDRCTPSGGEGCAINVIVRTSDQKEVARYAGEIPVAHLAQDAIAKINVENAACGAESCSLVWITLKPDGGLSKVRKPLSAVERGKYLEFPLDTAREFVDSMEALSARIGRLTRASTSGRRALIMDSTVVRELVGESRVDGGSETTSGVLREKRLSNPPRVILRQGVSTPAELPNIVVMNSAGTVLKEIAADAQRLSTKSPLDEIKTEDIAAIEVYKGNTCANVSKLGCPLIKITLKPGREAAYRKR